MANKIAMFVGWAVLIFFSLGAAGLTDFEISIGKPFPSKCNAASADTDGKE